MTIRRTELLILFTGVALLGHLTAAPLQKGATADDLSRAAAEYYATYVDDVFGITLDEAYTLRDTTGGRLNRTVNLNSDIVLVKVSGNVVALRDTYAADAYPTRKHEPRIAPLIAAPTPESMSRVQSYASEWARYAKEELVVRTNDPMLALQVVRRENQARVTYKLGGRKRIDGVDAVALSFEETKTPDAAYIIATPGRAAASGRLWLDEASGRIVRTELSLNSNTERARIDVTYAHDAKLDLWLPKQMGDSYEIRERSFSSYTTRAYDGQASYTNPQPRLR